MHVRYRYDGPPACLALALLPRVHLNPWSKMEQFKDFDNTDMFLKYGLEFRRLDEIGDTMESALDLFKEFKEQSAEWAESAKRPEDAHRQEALEDLHNHITECIEEWTPLVAEHQAGKRNLETNRREEESS